MKELQKQLQDYVCFNIQEEEDRAYAIAFLNKQEDAFERSNPIAHITVSAWITDPTFTKILMVHHNLFHAWSFCGGHADGQQDLQEVIRKEIQEETGVQKIQFQESTIFGIEVLPVKEHLKKGKKIPAHKHINITYWIVVSPSETLQSEPSENMAVEWIASQDLLTKVQEEHMHPIYQKYMDKVKLKVMYSCKKNENFVHSYQ